MIYNWNTSPIKSIELSNIKDYEFASIKSNLSNKYSFYDWRKNYFKIERLDKFDYMNLYKNSNGKICGKDSYGNNLYFPETIECPINDIIITNSTTNLTDYIKIYLGDNYYLCYTNKNTEGEILIDLKASSYKGVQLNLEKTNEICEDYYDNELSDLFFKNPKEDCESFYNFSTIPFYKKIDEWKYLFFINIKEFHSKEQIYLYAINYLGINSTLIKDRKKIENFRKKMNIYNRFSICKFVISILISVFNFATIIILIIDKKYVELIYSIIICAILIFYIVISIICFTINLNYVQKLMNKINKDFQNNKKDYIYNIIIIIYGFFLLLIYIIIIIYSLFSDFEGNFNFRRNINPPLQTNQTIIDNSQSFRNNNINSQNSNINVPQINLTESNIKQDNKQKRNNNNINNGKPRIVNNKNKNDLYPKKINRSFNPEISEKFYKQFEPINKDSIKLKKKNNCVYCGVGPSKIIFSPCGHRCLCQDCYNTNSNKIINCPICRKTIRDFIKNVYDV